MTPPAFIYTVGLSLKLGYELIAVQVPDGDLMNDVCRQLISGDIAVGQVHETDEYTVDTKPLRFVVRDLGINTKTASHVTFRLPEIPVTDVKQLLIGDPNNRLPGEEGHDERFVQTLEGMDAYVESPNWA